MNNVINDLIIVLLIMSLISWSGWLVTHITLHNLSKHHNQLIEKSLQDHGVLTEQQSRIIYLEAQVALYRQILHQYFGYKEENNVPARNKQFRNRQ